MSLIPCRVEVQPDGRGTIELLSKRLNGSLSHADTDELENDDE